MTKLKFYSKTIYFPEHEILAIGDLHLGYEDMLKSQGIIFPFNQLKDTQKQIKEILDKIKKQGYRLKKIILLGDIKHHFGFDIKENTSIKLFLRFLKNYITNQNIILIKGNHDQVKLKDKKYHDFYIKDDIAFAHGDKWYKELEDKKIKTIVLSHIHPAISLKDPKGIKKEKYKCFLIGKYKKKEFIIIPSFFPLIEGSEINEEYKNSKRWQQIIPKNKLQKFQVFIIGKNKIYNFGELKNIKN